MTIVALAAMVPRANQAAVRLAEEGISVEVVDPRTTSPLDEDGICESVDATGRLVVVDESAARCGFAHGVAAMVAQKAFSSLKAPVQIVTPPHTPVPFATVLESAWLPDVDRICDAVRKAVSS